MAAMNLEHLRAWWFHKQGLDGSIRSKSSPEILEKTGWMRSVGGANPYVGLFVRKGASSDSVDAACAKLEMFELPSARGCTYVVPASHYAMALLMAQGQGDEATIANAKKFCGVTDEEINRLSEGVLLALKQCTLDPKALKDQLGDLVRNLGPEGKKRGMTTTLSMVLGRLQTQGKIRRKPVNGRLDSQRYAYEIWTDSPLESAVISKEEALAAFAKLYFNWIGPATAPFLQWMTGLGVKATAELITSAKLVPIEEGSEFLINPGDLDEFKSFQVPPEPIFQFVSSLDNSIHLRRDHRWLVDESDKGFEVLSEKGLGPIGGLVDLPCNAILDRGRQIGFWEFDFDAKEVVYRTFSGDKPEALKKEAAKMTAFLNEGLGDCRSFSLDSPESRRPRIELLRS